MMAGSIQQWQLAWRWSQAEWRAGVRGFTIFLACLILGVGSIAAVASLARSIDSGLARDARQLLGGDLDIRLTHREATPDELQFLHGNSQQIATIVEMRSMAHRLDDSDRKLVELKAVDSAYPLVGSLVVTSADGPQTIATGGVEPLLSQQGGQWGVLIGAALATRLDLALGDLVRIGDLAFIIRGIITQEPDRTTQAFNLGPRVIIAIAALPATGLVQPGSLLRYHYRLALASDQPLTPLIDALNSRFPEAGWRIRSRDNAAPNIQQFIDRLRLFLTLAGLTALLVGGVGIGNATHAFLQQRLPSIATFKTLGAATGLMLRLYGLQLLAIIGLGTILGLALGAIAPLFLVPLIAAQLPINAAFGLYPDALLEAASYGLLVSALFIAGPLYRAATISPITLYRPVYQPSSLWRHKPLLFSYLGLGAALVALILTQAYQPLFALAFLAGLALILGIFYGLARGLAGVVHRLPRPSRASLTIAFANFYRPQSGLLAIVISMGLGLTLLICVTQIAGNLRHQLSDDLAREAPGFYFIDILPDQLADFRQQVQQFPSVQGLDDVPMLRGRISAIKDTAVDQLTIPPEVAWVLRGDRGLTWASEAPDQAIITEGQWWAKDYRGPLLVSLDAEVGQAFGLKLGDRLSVNLLGRTITATIANFRAINWSSFGINFVMVFSPGVLDNAPQSYLAAVYLDASKEAALEQQISKKFPNISAIRVKEILGEIIRILDSLAIAVGGIAGLAILSGCLVLTGAMAAIHQRRRYDNAIYKCLGARPGDIVSAQLIEYGMIGLLAGTIALICGTAAAYAIVTWVMEARWVFIPAPALQILLLALLATLTIGCIMTWQNLKGSTAQLLRQGE